MIKKQISKGLKQTCWDWLQKNNMGTRSVFNGTKEQQLVGLIGEIMVKEHFDSAHNWTPGFDDGFDFERYGKRVDVKTMTRKTDVNPEQYVNNIFARQLNFNCDVYVFASLNTKKNELTICGWIYKIEILKYFEMIPKGTTRKFGEMGTFDTSVDAYEIPMNKLNDIKTKW